MTIGSFLCLPARGGFVTSTFLIRFHSSCDNECMGNGGLGANEYCMTMGRLGLGLVGLEGDALGSSALLAWDRGNQLFLVLGLGGQRVWAKTIF